MKTAAFPVVVPCSLVDIYRRFGGACCINFRAIDALMMEISSTSETSVNIYQTNYCNSPEKSHLHKNIFSRLLKDFAFKATLGFS
jgi:hypothetical protein